MLEDLHLPVAGEDGTPSDDEHVVSEARDRLARAIEYESNIREQAADDVRFLSGEQWPQKVRQEREEDGRPVLTINKLPQYVEQVVGEERQNRPSIKVVPSSGVSVPKTKNLRGDKGYDLAEIYTGLIRDIEQRSAADQAYDWAFQQSVEHGFGHWRVLTEYSGDDSFDQDIRIKRIRNAFQVYWDPVSEEWDKSDAQWCIVSSEIHKNDFRARWPDSSMAALEGAEGDWTVHWFHDELVRIAEYWRKVPHTKTLHLLSDGAVVDGEKWVKIGDELAEQGITSIRERRVKSYKIEWRLMNGVEVLEGPKDWPGQYIPIVTCYGRELFVDGRPEYRGIIRHAKEPQRMFNFWRTSSTEQVALAPKVPWVVSDDQIDGFEDLWVHANTKNYSYLPYRHTGAPPPQRPTMPQIPPGAVNEALSAGEDIKAAVGMYNPSVGNREDTASGIAIERLQRKADTATFSFIDNLTRAIRHTGKILIDLIPRVYDGERIVRIAAWDETEDFVEINKTVLDEQTGETVVMADLSVGRYDVRVRAGPSYATQREEAQDGMLQFIQTVPDLAAQVADLFAEAMDWPNADKIAKRLKKALPPAMLEPGELDEEDQPPPPEPTPAEQAELAKAEAEMAKAEATKAKAAADTLAAQVEMATAGLHAEADVVRTEADIENARTGVVNQRMDSEERLAARGQDSEAQIREQVASAIAELIASGQLQQILAAGPQPPAQ